jgi:tetratricopeptide (TPR) repeat protein
MLALDPSFSHALNNKGALLSMLDRFNEALPVLERATRADPDNGQAWNNLGFCLHILGLSSEALEHFRTAWDRGYRHEGVLYNEGVAHLACGDLPAGIDSWRRSLSVNPFQPALLERFAQLAQMLGVPPDADPEVLAARLTDAVRTLRVSEVLHTPGSHEFVIVIPRPDDAPLGMVVTS